MIVIVEELVVYRYSSSQSNLPHGCMPYRITQCYLPPDRGYIPAFTPTEAGT